MRHDDWKIRHPHRDTTPTGMFAPPTPEDIRQNTLTNRFISFHAKHPEVYEALLRLAQQARTAGRVKAGIGMLYEVVRWERYIAGLPDTEEGFKLNNDYRSRYARLIMLEHPELEGLFELRELHTS